MNNAANNDKFYLQLLLPSTAMTTSTTSTLHGVFPTLQDIQAQGMIDSFPLVPILTIGPA